MANGTIKLAYGSDNNGVEQQQQRVVLDEATMKMLRCEKTFSTYTVNE
jgi:hypothetical protein